MLRHEPLTDWLVAWHALRGNIDAGLGVAIACVQAMNSIGTFCLFNLASNLIRDLIGHGLRADV